jgi:hypothetical protein
MDTALNARLLYITVAFETNLSAPILGAPENPKHNDQTFVSESSQEPPL